MSAYRCAYDYANVFVCIDADAYVHIPKIFTRGGIPERQLLENLEFLPNAILKSVFPLDFPPAIPYIFQVWGLDQGFLLW